MGVQPGECQCCERDGSQRVARNLGGLGQDLWIECASGSKERIDNKEPCSPEPRHGDEPRGHVEQGPEPCDAGKYEDDVREHADKHRGTHVLAAYALPQDERVLCADGYNQRQPRGKTGKQRK